MGLLSDSKDRLMQKMVLPLLNRSILEPYGRATNLLINSTAKTLDLELELKGEPDLVRIQIRDYELRKEGDRAFAIIKDVETSKAWLTALAERHLLNRPVTLPPQVAGVLLRLL